MDSSPTCVRSANLHIHYLIYNSFEMSREPSEPRKPQALPLRSLEPNVCREGCLCLCLTIFQPPGTMTRGVAAKCCSDGRLQAQKGRIHAEDGM